MKYILTYNDAKKLCNTYKNFNFREHIYNVEGYKVSTFDYFLCDYNHFNNPLLEEPSINAFDMRGFTCVFNKDGSLFASYFMLPKFFNLNQVEITQYDELKNKKISNITLKEDGSLIAFMKLPNENVFAKTIGGIGNEQSNEAFKLYNNNDKLKTFVIKSLNEGYTPLFEYVSFSNRIVLLYNKPELKFIGLRKNSGNYEFISQAKLKIEGIDSVRCEYNKSLDDLIKDSKTLKDIEGWVVEFEDGQLVKIKTEWYFNIHHLRTEQIFREDYIIKHFLKGTLDDVICQLDKNKNSDVINFIDEVKNATLNWSAKIDKDVDELMKQYNGDIKEFAIKNHKHYAFQFCVALIKGEDYNKNKINYMLTKSRKLQNAKFYVKKFK